ncbi:hypothetical protein SEVIR_3G147100v4 [Setaria viridis]|uniref:Uncharacterized protein n=2 Tax=Setaria TaxID=4554 RepID=A0A368QEV3_SETIT|nr:uncharacterized protein LOC101768358 [Setaria italica]XP_034587921.1 uncharacterized protein LOC117850221 [Setaria viridis]RCV16517.1 hypothetical protein SETIT_3G144900v2 [Setaria italica]TKW25855.1 hypothetical protein SEVIR_3G147100v2 [Setaria viridis]
MAIEADTVAAARAASVSVSETAPMSPAASAAAAAGTARPRVGWLKKLIPRDYLPRSRRWRLAAPSAGGASRLASSLSRSLRWKRLPGLSSLSLRSGSASAVVDAVAFRVMYVVEAVVLGLALSCFFLCCGCHL